jgi:squalene synthase HpnC
VESLLLQRQAPYTVEEGYAACAALARTHYENFTVVSRFLPADKRDHMNAVYAFCRSVDDLGDEYQGDRLAALDEWEADLRRCYDSTPLHPYMVALQATIRRFDLPVEPFLRLVEANRMDQTTKRRRTFEDLEHYCTHSANPVGHLTLYVFGYRDENRQHLSDFTCTALQLANFWQDVVRDYRMGRIYIPLEDMERFGYTEAELAEGVVTESFRSLMKFEVDRARGLFMRGFDLVDTLDGRFKLDVALFTKGGLSVLDAIERRDYDVLSGRPVVTRATKLRLMAGTALKLVLTGRA